MLGFLAKRLANAVGVMLAVALIAFLIFRFVGDPVELMLNEQASQAQRDELRERLGLNRNVLMQFLTFVGNVARGDFGISYRNQQEVFTLIAERFPATFELVLVATLLSLAVGIPLGVYTAIRRDSVLAQGAAVHLGAWRLIAELRAWHPLHPRLLGDAAVAAGLRSR